MLDLVEVAKVEMVEPSGWINVDLDSGKDDSVRAFMLQVQSILQFLQPFMRHATETTFNHFIISDFQKYIH